MFLTGKAFVKQQAVPFFIADELCGVCRNNEVDVAFKNLMRRVDSIA